MGKTRLEAFSDGVIAIILTIMVLELRPPHGDDLLPALLSLTSPLLGYVLSFTYVAIYWNNHHHMLHATRQVNGVVLWANIHLLFWLSLVPAITAWVGEHPSSSVPVAAYGVVLLMAGVAYVVLQGAIVRLEGKDSLLARAVGKEWKGKISAALYVVGVLVAFVQPRIAEGIYAGVAILWLVPDPRIERAQREA